MSQNTLNFALNFATLFQCAIKPLKSKNQREAVNALLIRPEETSISNAASSNYTSGKRAVPDQFRRTLASLSIEELRKRLKYIGILEYDIMCDALLRLVECAKLPASQRKRLIDTYHNSEQMEFIQSMVYAAADYKEATPLSNADIEYLKGFAVVESTVKPADDTFTTANDTETNTDSAIRYHIPTHQFEDKYDHNWVNEYTSQKIDAEEIRNRDFFGSTVVSSQQVLNLPYDFPKLLSLLTPMVKGDPIDEFTVEDFMDLMSISRVNNEVTNGSMECLTLIGPAQGVVNYISRYDLSDVSDVAILMAGKVTIRDAKDIESVIRSSTNKNVNCIQAMWFDEKISEIEVTFILHVYPEEVKRQSAYDIDGEGVKIPNQHKGNR